MAKTKKPRAATPKEREFVVEYIWGEHAGNGGACAEKVGFCHDRPSARRYAHTLLRRPHIRQLVEKESAEKERQLKQKAARVADEVYRLATADIGDVVGEDGTLLELHAMPEDVRRAIGSIEVEELFEGHGEDRRHIGELHKVKLHDKRAAQELFLKYAGKLKDNVKLEVDGVTLDQLVPRRKTEPEQE